MKQFFKFMFASMLGFGLTIIVLFFLLMAMFAAALSMGKKEIVVVPKNAILHMALDKPIHDRAPVTPDFTNLTKFSMEKNPGLDDILKNIKKAKEDDHIKGIYLDLSNLQAGFATIDEIRKELLDFKESDKWIISYADYYTQASYYLASASDKVYMNPMGVMVFKGLNAELMFLKGTLDKLHIEPQVIRPENNQFKSALEPFFLDKMSEANRKQMTKLIFSLWDHVVAGISESRNISKKELNEIADNLSVFKRNENAKEMKLIDGLLYKDELLAELRNRLELEEKEKIPFIKLTKYTATKVSKGKKKYTRNKIAVVYALGSIGMGEGDDYTIGADRLSKAIRQARLDTNIRAIVLRVNSPGGDALASDIILRELILAKKEKPIVASYGNVAASGGYWISCQAHKIIADENTITGSIGVFGFLPNLQGFYNDKLGITFDNAATNENAGFPSVNRKMTVYEGVIMQAFVESVYQKFLKYVSEARNMTVEEVDEIAQGRVWSGTDAKEIGLIDDFGGLDDAIILAAEMAEVEEYKILSLPKQKDPFQQIMDELMGKSTQSMIEKELGVNYKYYHYIKEVSEMKGVQARLPFEISIN